MPHLTHNDFEYRYSLRCTAFHRKGDKARDVWLEDEYGEWVEVGTLKYSTVEQNCWTLNDVTSPQRGYVIHTAIRQYLKDNYGEEQCRLGEFQNEPRLIPTARQVHTRRGVPAWLG